MRHAPGVRASGAPACERSARAAGGRDTPPGPVTADARIHDVSETGGLGRGWPGQGHLDAAILRAPLGRFVRGDGIRLAVPPRRDHVRLHAVRDEILHHLFGTLLRQHLVRGDALPLQRLPDGGVIRIAVHHELRLLKRRQLRDQLGDDLLPLRGHLPGARPEQQVAVDGVLDGVLQPADVHLAGINLLFQGGHFRGTLRRLGRRRLLQLLILALQSVVLALQLGVFALQIVVFAL